MMPYYVYSCPVHGLIEVQKSMDQAKRPEWCAACMPAATQLRRIFTGQGFIMRPSGWHLKPGDRGYSDFRRELELGEVRGPSAERTPLVADEPEAPVALKMPDDVMQEIHELGRVVDRQIREEMALPPAILDLVPA